MCVLLEQDRTACEKRSTYLPTLRQTGWYGRNSHVGTEALPALEFRLVVAEVGFELVGDVVFAELGVFLAALLEAAG